MSTQLEGPAHSATSGWRVLAPFQFREYRLLIAAVAISIFATGMWAVVMALQVIALNNDPASLSLVAACFAGGMLTFALVGGVTADRFPQRSIIIAVETANFGLVSTAAVLGLTGALQLWHMAVVATLLGVGAGFFYPAYSAYLPRILPAEQLLAANGVEGVVRPTLQQAIGPAAAGVLVGATLPTAGLVVVAALFGAGLALLVATRPATKPQEVADKAHPLVDLRDGFLFMIRTPWLLWTLLFASLFVLVALGPIEVLLPFIAADRFDNGRARLWFRARGVRRRRCHRRAADFFSPDAAPLPHGDAAVLGNRRDATRGRRVDLVFRSDGRGDVRGRRGRRSGDGHLGHAAPAPGTARHARPHIQP